MRKYLAACGLALLLGGCTENAPDHLDSARRGILNSPVTRNQSSSPQPSYPQPQPQPAPYYGSGPRAWIPHVRPHAWKYIVIHHSATAVGSATSFDRAHRQKGWDELGYHFVVGNGTYSADGLVEVGGRWTSQKIGAHAGVRRYNEDGIGICLVGDFQSGHPTSAQLRSLATLTAHLMKTYRIPAAQVIGHGQIPAKHTNCPGQHLSIASVRTLATRIASSDSSLLTDYAMGGNLFQDWLVATLR